MSRTILSLGLVFALGPGAALVAAQARSLDADLALGIKQVDEGDFEMAIVSLEEVIKRLSAERGQSKELSRAYLYMSIAYLGLSQEASAKGRICDALKNNPDLQLSPREFSPKIRDFFNKARSEFCGPTVVQRVPTAAVIASFFDAVKRGDFPSVRDQLVEYPSLVAQREVGFGATPLHWAALRGHEAVVALLVAEGADQQARNNAGETPLQVAQRAGRSNVVTLLQPTGPVQRFVDAVRAGDLARVRQLLGDNPSLVNQKDATFGATPLHWAALKGYREVVEFLVASGADLSARNDQGETALQVAERAGRTSVIPLLRPAGVAASPSGARPARSGSLIEAVKSGELARVRQALREDPASLDEKDPQFGATPLHWAALRGYREIAAFLVSEGADTSATNDTGETPLRVAERAGKTEVAQLLRGVRR